MGESSRLVLSSVSVTTCDICYFCSVQPDEVSPCSTAPQTPEFEDSMSEKFRNVLSYNHAASSFES